MRTSYFLIIGLIFGLLSSCSSEDPQTNTKPYALKVPSHFPPAIIPADNPLTEAKVKLGRMLFYEKRISEDQLVACANCHKQEFAFGSDKPLDKKVHGGMTTRNSSVLFNLAFTKEFFWDGRTKTLEATCKDALEGEQKFNIDFVKTRLMPEQRYKDALKAAFNVTEPTDDMVEKALASFIRTMVSGSSRVDKGKVEGNPNKYLSTMEIEGRTIFEDEEGDCFHCHGEITGKALMTDNLFHNNGLDPFMSAGLFKDPGLGFVTGVSGPDVGKFKTGALRNLSYSAPFMHDGRLPNLDAVLKHYNSGLKISVTIDPNMKKANQGGLQLTPDRIARLKAYLLAFDDPTFISDTSFSNPFK
jgi:cytochrome c peroxidase